MSTIDAILNLLETHGDSQYGGEAVTQREHALQTAMLARNADAPASLVTAALLHDVGHLLHHLPEDAPDHGIDDHHENSGDRFLRSLFPASVTEPIRLHVAAKRYLCTIDPGYYTQLSEPSIVSLRLQGGEMSEEEVDQFQANPHHQAAIRLRHWDDEAKVADQVTPSVADFRGEVEVSVR